MILRAAIVVAIAILTPLCRVAEPGPAAQGCAAFSWNVTNLLEVMRLQPIPVIAAVDSSSAPSMLVPGRHYAVTLHPQDSVKFAIAPARAARDPRPQGGWLRFEVNSAGRYRIAVTTRHWIDVVENGRAIDSSDHQGADGCELMHKIVEFELPANTPLTLQLSGRADSVIGLVIIPVQATR